MVVILFSPECVKKDNSTVTKCTKRTLKMCFKENFILLCNLYSSNFSFSWQTKTTEQRLKLLEGLLIFSVKIFEENVKRSI